MRRNPEFDPLVGFSDGVKECEAVKEGLKEDDNGGSDSVVGLPDGAVVGCGKGRKVDAGGGCRSSKDEAETNESISSGRNELQQVM